ncbi:MAG: rod shape-determining protein MreD [Anaerolineae bacterium CG2_30_64_16]|nr:MAG: rod shape-determining protein MreD [Anaerolineae bacterium CG2_30_64_16]
MPERTGPSATGIKRNLSNLSLTLTVVALAVLLQATLLTRVRVLGVSPDLLLVAVVAWSLLHGATEGLIWGFIGGLGLDLVAGMPLGTSSLALMAICFLAGLGTNSVFAGNLLLPIFLAGLATPVHGWIILLSAQLRGLRVDWIASTVRVIGPGILLNAALMVLVYPALRGLATRVGAQQMEW